jgi:hypothetical protein
MIASASASTSSSVIPMSCETICSEVAMDVAPELTRLRLLLLQTASA